MLIGGAVHFVNYRNDGLLAFVENFLKDHFLPTMFVDYRKGVQQAISSKAHVATAYTPSIEKGRPVLQGLLTIDHLTKEVLGWAQAMPKFANDLVKYVQTFLERTYERCRTAYMESGYNLTLSSPSLSLAMFVVVTVINVNITTILHCHSILRSQATQPQWSHYQPILSVPSTLIFALPVFGTCHPCTAFLLPKSLCNTIEVISLKQTNHYMVSHLAKARAVVAVKRFLVANTLEEFNKKLGRYYMVLVAKFRHWLTRLSVEVDSSKFVQILIGVDLANLDQYQLGQIQSGSNQSNLAKFWRRLTQPNWVEFRLIDDGLVEFDQSLIMINFVKFNQISLVAEFSQIFIVAWPTWSLLTFGLGQPVTTFSSNRPISTFGLGRPEVSTYVSMYYNLKTSKLHRKNCGASHVFGQLRAVLEKQSYMLIGRHDIDKLMRLDSSSAYLPNLLGQFNVESNSSDAETIEAESELSELLLNLHPIKQENLIHDDNKLILLASLSDSLEYVADSIERLWVVEQFHSQQETCFAGIVEGLLVRLVKFCKSPIMLKQFSVEGKKVWIPLAAKNTCSLLSNVKLLVRTPLGVNFSLGSS
ncbi:hypothetical protein V8G54_002276 [Vigna mungo]|uniref:Exocyst complex component Sec8 n=1 Tax=Vigna mungo TaxID=3915 RepID=A0AAQ3SAP0_VIGMU